ncbi:hypothetical protein FALCPG4_009198 [Fusarium falciforme]
MDGWTDGLVVGNCRPSSSVNPLLLFGLARAEWNMPRQIADPVTFWRSFPPAFSFSLDSPCTLFEPVLTVPLSPDSCLKTSLGDSDTPSRFQLTIPSDNQRVFVLQVRRPSAIFKARLRDQIHLLLLHHPPSFKRYATHLVLLLPLLRVFLPPTQAHCSTRSSPIPSQDQVHDQPSSALHVARRRRRLCALKIPAPLPASAPGMMAVNDACQANAPIRFCSPSTRSLVAQLMDGLVMILKLV